ncbi:hypothetical protein INT80_04325 [Gallibacterium anatis]|uniref:Uncharacterized protein n=1 Tax=Gallibacterium anatis TaxID=750 RepID=A0A930UX90_9PAST|nr:hypothetical protein [Gallibacterium anatis]
MRQTTFLMRRTTGTRHHCTAAPTGLAADNSGTNTVISGKAEPNSKVVIDGKEYPVNAAGDFSADLGKN